MVDMVNCIDWFLNMEAAYTAGVNASQFSLIRFSCVCWGLPQPMLWELLVCSFFLSFFLSSVFIFLALFFFNGLYSFRVMLASSDELRLIHPSLYYFRNKCFKLLLLFLGWVFGNIFHEIIYQVLCLPSELHTHHYTLRYSFIYKCCSKMLAFIYRKNSLFFPFIVISWRLITIL